MRSKIVVLLAACAGAIVVGGLAMAYWTQSGGGSGAASTGTPAAITVNQTSTISGLYPGGPAVALAGTFTNSNAHGVSVSSVTASVHAFTAHADLTKPDCTAADFQIGGTSGATVVAPGANVGSWTGLTVRMLDNSANQDNCKNVTIAIDYAANP